MNETVKGDDPAAINTAVEELGRASQAMAEHLYAANAAAGATAGAPGGAAAADASANGGRTGGQTDDVIDVEFEEKK